MYYILYDNWYFKYYHGSQTSKDYPRVIHPTTPVPLPSLDDAKSALKQNFMSSNDLSYTAIYYSLAYSWLLHEVGQHSEEVDNFLRLTTRVCQHPGSISLTHWGYINPHWEPRLSRHHVTARMDYKKRLRSSWSTRIWTNRRPFNIEIWDGKTKLSR